MALTKVTGQGLETLSDGVTITTADNTAQLTLTSTDTDANAGPHLNLYRNATGADSDAIGQVEFTGKDDAGNDFIFAQIESYISDASNGAEAGYLEIFRGVGGTERVSGMVLSPTETVFNDNSGDIDFRVETNGQASILFADGANNNLHIQSAATPSATVSGFMFSSDQLYTSAGATAGSNTQVRFINTNGLVGNITTANSGTAFNTSSDYRLKENVSYTWDATTRLKQLKPARFNFISDSSNTLLDGFLAHEVSNTVPNAVTGTKDATIQENGDGYQHIDHSKLVPLLVKTIQELEARLTAGGL